MLYGYYQVDKSKIKGTSLLQYINLKENYNDGIVLYENGAFYDTFFDDARTTANITGLTLSVKRMSAIGEYHQTGIPKTNFFLYVKKLLDNNIKIYLCEQLEDKEEGSIKRELTRIFTPGTIIEKELLDSYENNYIASLYYDKNIVKLAYADVSTGQLYKTEGKINEIEFEIGKISPKEILISEKQEDYFEKFLQDYYFVAVEEENFKNFNIEDVIINYCELNQKKYFAKLDKVVEYKLETFLMMDDVTRKSLELTKTRKQSKKKGSLLWFLNYTKTTMGARLLKKYINEPLLDIKDIKKRQSAVAELLKSEDLLNQYESTLENFCDLSRICTKISNSTIKPKELLEIASCSNVIEKLNELSKNVKSKLLYLNNSKLNDILKLSKEIKNALDEDINDKTKDDYIIKKNYSAELDYLRDKYENCKKEIKDYEKKLRKKLNIDELEIEYKRALGYFIEIPATKRMYIYEKDYIKKQTTENVIRYTTEKLSALESDLIILKYKIDSAQEEIYNKLKKYADSFTQNMRSLSSEIARIDVLVSFARCAKNNNLKKPEFQNDGIEIQNGFHPSLIKLNNQVIKNDTSLKNNSMIILTGANMSGKSTYLKYNAIIPILGQIGSFVPADKTILTITDKIFLRQGSTDDIINNNSSFMVEMNDLKFIIDNVTNKSLILLDEPAKSTSTNEGGAIVKAFCEYILNNFKTKTIIVTHNLDITKLEEQYPDRIFNYATGSNENNKINDRKIRRGTAQTSSAINTAILADLPDEIIKKAKEYLEI